MTQETTVGRLLIDEALPAELRGKYGNLTKKNIEELHKQIGTGFPDKYEDASLKLQKEAFNAAYLSGGFSTGVTDLSAPPEVQAKREQLRNAINAIINDRTLTDAARNEKLIAATMAANNEITKATYAAALASGNPLALQAFTGAKGNPDNVKSILVGDGLYTDAKYKTIPFPVLRSYAEGLEPHEYFAGTFGARSGVVTLKVGTASGGYASKRMKQLAHRLVVTAQDEDSPHDTVRGLPVDINDPHNEGAVLAAPIAGYQRNTILTPKIIADIKAKHAGRILVRSPIVGGAADGGVLGRDVGVRERGVIAPIGDQVGLTAADSVSEPMVQSLIGAKHTGGVAGATGKQQGFPVMDRLISIPENFPGAAAHARTDGVVKSISPAPQGGHIVTIDDAAHYVGADQQVKVKVGDNIEAGDMLSDGVPNPAELVAHKGIGEGRRQFIDTFSGVARGAGFTPHRRNMELLARGLIDHVELHEESGDHIPGDIVSYQTLEHSYTPRDGHEILKPKAALNKYLERPVLHYTIGTRVTPSVIKNMTEFGIAQVPVHAEPPPFTPVMIRSQDTMNYDPDWMTRHLGSNLEKSLLKGVHRGDVADPLGTSFVPALAAGMGIGTRGKVLGFDAEKVEAERKKSIL